MSVIPQDVQNLRRPPARRSGTVMRGLCTLAMTAWIGGELTCLSGCQLLSGDYYAAYREPPRDVHEIAALRLSELSQSPPVTVEEATAAAEQQAEAAANPAASLELSLPEVRAAALAGNLDLKVQLIDPSIAEQKITEEQARFEALLYGSLKHRRVDHPPRILTDLPEDAYATQADTGVRIPLRTGGEVDVGLPIARFDDQQVTGRPSESNGWVIDPAYDAGLKFSISQPLLRNAGVRANTHAIRVAKFERDIVDARTKLQVIGTLANADRAYWAVYATRRELEVREEQYRLALQQLSDARKRVAAGDAPQIEIMRAESGVASRLEAIIVARTELLRHERDLKRIMNRADLPMESAAAFTPTTDPAPVGLDLDTEKLTEYALAQRMELLELELELAVDASTIDLEKNASLPLFMLDYTYQTNGVGRTFNDAAHDIDGHRYADHVIGLRAEVPVGNQAAKARLRRALLHRVQRLATREQHEAAIRQEVYDAVDALEQDWQRILAARQEVVLAGRTYEAERKQFEVGLRTSTDVLEAAARLAYAQSREIQALAAYEISQVHIAVACGALLGQSGVVWEAIDLH